MPIYRDRMPICRDRMPIGRSHIPIFRCLHRHHGEFLLLIKDWETRVYELERNAEDFKYDENKIYLLTTFPVTRLTCSDVAKIFIVCLIWNQVPFHSYAQVCTEKAVLQDIGFPIAIYEKIIWKAFYFVGRLLVSRLSKAMFLIFFEEFLLLFVLIHWNAFPDSWTTLTSITAY